MILRLLFPKNSTRVCPGTARASCNSALSRICAHEWTTGGALRAQWRAAGGRVRLQS